jgi:hypothetical protein
MAPQLLECILIYLLLCSYYYTIVVYILKIVLLTTLIHVPMFQKGPQSTVQGKGPKCSTFLCIGHFLIKSTIVHLFRKQSNADRALWCPVQVVVIIDVFVGQLQPKMCIGFVKF